MAYKRQIDRLPIVPKDAKEFNVTCHYCIVGCGYKAYTWPINQQGDTAPDQNKFGIDLSKQQEAETAAWYSPAMYNIVQQNGEDVHIVVKPDKNCVVNSGLGSIRGARIAEMSYSRARNTQLQRLTDPMVWRYGQMQPTSWGDALDLVARVTAAVINDMGEDGLFVSAFDHGGAGGGYENTWGTGKLYFGAMKVKNIRIHNRPAYNSEVHATRDMGIGELNNCYEDAELADTIVAVGTNALETQTNYFLNHWVSNLRGTSMNKKRAEFESEPDGKFNSKDGKATFMETQWRGLQADGKEAEKNKWPFLINNGRTNHVWQNAYLDQQNDFVMDRWPYPFIEMNSQDMTELNVKAGDLVEVYNDNGSTQAMVYPTATARRKQTFMLFANPNGVQGNVVSPGVNEFIIPNYKQTWAAIRKIADAPEGVRHLTFKSQEYTVG